MARDDENYRTVYVEREEPRRKKRSCLLTLIDFILVFATGGLWLVWILIRYLRER